MNDPIRALAMALFVGLLASCTATSNRMRMMSKSSDLPAIARAQQGGDEPPPAIREFRAAWVATVGNIDWPSKAGLSTADQKREVIQILDRAREMNLNAIVLQVRATADALYDSKLEPWSQFLTGTQGKAPEPYYDPLQFWIDQSHKRGLELHAWFNPYRTKYAGSKGTPAQSHISQTHPEIVKAYGNMGWMDPGEALAADHSFRVFMDVVERYDVDGIHIDDYFYPYPVPVNPDDKNDKRELPFPDEPSYTKYQESGGKLSRNDWRRDNINRLINRNYEGIKARKKNVEFGISPFGIPRPGLTGIEYVKGFDQHEKLYADTTYWLREGWCDYFVPQLYWKTGAPQQPFLGLLQWWTKNNPKGRHIYAGLFTSRIDWSDVSWYPDEIIGQTMITRLVPGAGGQVHFSMIALAQNRKKVAELMRDGIYAHPALVPASPWLDNTPPAAPKDVRVDRVSAAATQPAAKAQATDDKWEEKPATTKPYYALTPAKSPDKPLASVQVKWSADDQGERPAVWAVYYRQGDEWQMTVIPGDQNDAILRDSPLAGPATRVSVAAVDRCGNESKRVSINTGFMKE